MSGTIHSFIVQYQQEVWADEIQSQIVRLDTSEYIHLRNGSILLRVFIDFMDENPTIVRCLVRHLNSGREVYVQGGPKLLAFVKDCLLTDRESPGHGDMTSPEK